MDAGNRFFLAKLKAEGRPPAAPTPENPLAPYELTLANLDTLLPLLRKHDIQVILTLSAIYGSKAGDVFYETDENDYNKHMPELWGALAKRYRNESIIIGYDIKNEPNYRDPVIAKKIWWDDLLPNSIAAIRKHDDQVWLVVEAPPTGGMPWGFAQMPLIDDPRVMYSFHHYMPHAYTHQGIRGIQKRGPDTRGHYTWPGKSPRFDGGKPVDWDKTALERTMQEVILFQRRNPGARIFVGEFGAARWAPGAAQWLADSLEIFERHGWDWTLHSFTSAFNAWDPTYAPDDNLKSRPDYPEGAKDTGYFRVIKKELLKNTALPPPPPPVTIATDSADSTNPATAAERTPHARWRGANTGIRHITEDYINYLAANHANAIRINFELDTYDPAYKAELKAAGKKAKPATPENPLAPYERNLARLDAMLPACRQLDIQIILAAAGLHGSRFDVFYEGDENERNAHLIDFWRAMSRRYRDEPAIVAWDIKNEPNYQDPRQAREIWWDWLLPECIKTIRANDAKIWLVIAAPPNGGMPWGFAQMPVIDDPRVMYTFHHYMPHAYTHQGVRAIQKRGPDTRGLYTYPGDSPRFDSGKMVAGWNKASVEKTMEEVIHFQKRNPGTRVFVGEFGVIRWAPGGEQWITDAIDLFEKHGWDWTFHSLGEWNGWDPTYLPDAPVENRPVFQEGIQETPRLKAVKTGWLLNARD
jgi:hypothetical protein